MMPAKDIRTRFTQILLLNDLPYWLAAVSVGLAAVLYADLFSRAEALARALLGASPYLIVVWSPLMFVGSWALVYFFGPEAKGSGIPQVMASIKRLESHDGEDKVDRLLGVRTIFVKVASSLLCVVGGGAVGREGPTIQVSAAIFHAVGKRSEKLLHRTLNREFWLITGGAAGIAAAFNTPLGGLVYAIEELATGHFNRFKTSLIGAVIVSGMASQWVSGPYLYLGFPKLTTAGLGSLPWAIALGLICGLAGGLFGESLLKTVRWTRRFRSPWSKAGWAAFCGLLVAGVAVITTQLSGLERGSEALGPGKETVVRLLFSPEHDEAGLGLTATRFLAPIVTYSAGTAGGIFAPALAAGGTLGRWLGELVSTPYTNLFVILGMIAFLTGVTHTPFTSFVLVLEMTDRHSAIFPMMLAALIAASAVKVVYRRSIYEEIRDEYLAKA